MNIFRKFSDAQDTIDARITQLKRGMNNIRTKMQRAPKNAKALESEYHDKYLEIRRLQAKRRQILNASADFYRNMHSYTTNELKAMARNDVNSVVNHIKCWSNI